MIRFLKWTRILFWWGLFTLILASAAAVGVYDFYRFPTMAEIQHFSNISDDYSRAYKKAAQKSRASAVMVMSGDLFFRGFAMSSGTYFIANDTPYVITAAHGIFGSCFLTTISHDESLYDCDEIVAIDRETDYAIIRLKEKMANREPVNIPRDLPRGSQWKSSYSLLNKIIYTGYPNVIGPLTLKGDVIGYTYDDYIYVFSHAYGGSSGSGVLSADGKYIGLIMAISVGESEFGVDVLENIVIVTPAYKVDWSVVLN